MAEVTPDIVITAKGGETMVVQDDSDPAEVASFLMKTGDYQAQLRDMTKHMPPGAMAQMMQDMLQTHSAAVDEEGKFDAEKFMHIMRSAPLDDSKLADDSPSQDTDEGAEDDDVPPLEGVSGDSSDGPAAQAAGRPARTGQQYGTLELMDAEMDIDELPLTKLVYVDMRAIMGACVVETILRSVEALQIIFAGLREPNLSAAVRKQMRAATKHCADGLQRYATESFGVSIVGRTEDGRMIVRRRELTQPKKMSPDDPGVSSFAKEMAEDRMYAELFASFATQSPESDKDGVVDVCRTTLHQFSAIRSRAAEAQAQRGARGDVRRDSRAHRARAAADARACAARGQQAREACPGHDRDVLYARAGCDRRDLRFDV